MSWIKTETGKNFLVLVFSILVSLLVLELFLRLYNPFGFRIKGDKIVLYPYKKYLIENSILKGVDAKIIHTKNSLGLRGSKPPKDFDAALTIVAVGGSTTEGFYLSDGKTWPEILEKKLKPDFPSIWINNAGLDGQSSWGHLILLKDYLAKLKPKVVIFYCGLNDVGLSAMNRYDDPSIGKEENLLKRAVKFLSIKSQLVSCLSNLYLYFSYKKTGITHGNLDLKTAQRLPVSKATKEELVSKEKEKAKEYALRLSQLARESRKNNIEPVFVSQAALCQKAKDKSSGSELGELKIENKFLNCETFGEVLTIYNQAMAETAKKEKVFFIDAQKLMPADSAYYYDFFHFNNAGAQAFAEILSAPLREFLKNKYNK